MAFPDPLRVLTLDQSIFDVEGAVAMTWKDIPIYDLSTYRNLYPNQIVEINAKTPSITGSDSIINTAAVQAAGAVTGTITNEFDLGPPATTTNQTKTVADDSVTATEPHPWRKLVTLVEFWDSATVGKAIAALGVTLTSGSTSVVVPDNRLLTPGQAISGTGIPVGSIIMDVPAETPGSIKISQPATANGAQAAVLTGGNCVAYYFAPEGIGGAPGCRILT
jgi:hypothetical protein